MYAKKEFEDKLTGKRIFKQKRIWIRRKINPVLRRILRLAAKNRIFIEEYPNIPKNQPVIFAATHYFDEDTISTLASIDRNAYVLIGTTDQLEYNRQMYAAWLNGMIYVDRCDAKSRKASVEKMERILRSGTSILMFPEGGLNNTENLLVNPLFSGPWLLARDTGLPVVPMAEFHEQGTKNVYLYAGEPLNIGTMEKDEALSLLRNEMARRIYRAIEEHRRTYLACGAQKIRGRLSEN